MKITIDLVILLMETRNPTKKKWVIGAEFWWFLFRNNKQYDIRWDASNIKWLYRRFLFIITGHSKPAKRYMWYVATRMYNINSMRPLTIQTPNIHIWRFESDNSPTTHFDCRPNSETFIAMQSQYVYLSDITQPLIALYFSVELSTFL